MSDGGRERGPTTFQAHDDRADHDGQDGYDGDGDDLGLARAASGASLDYAAKLALERRGECGQSVTGGSGVSEPQRASELFRQ